jgi:hypothetical protein
MTRMFKFYEARLNEAYAKQPRLVAMKAKLLIAINLLMFAFIVINVAKVLWLQPPNSGARIIANALIAASLGLSMRWVFLGKPELAGNSVAVAMVFIVHAAVLIVGAWVVPLQPLSLAIQLFAFDLVFLLFALVFASRTTATVVLAAIVVGHISFHHFLLPSAKLSPAIVFAAETLRRDGLLVMGLVFCLGITLMQMIGFAHRRSDESLRQSRDVNENLERLVSARTRALEISHLREAAVRNAVASGVVPYAKPVSTLERC